MKKTIRNLIVGAALAVASVFTSNAQSLQYFGGLSGNPLNGALSVSTNNVCLAASTNTYYAAYTTTNTAYTNGVISGTNILNNVASTNMVVIRDANKVTIQPMFTLSGAGTGTSIFRIDNSTDGQNWNNGVTNIAVVGNGAGVATTTANVESYGAMYWRVGQVQNTNAALFMTNIVCTAAKKIGT